MHAITWFSLTIPLEIPDWLLIPSSLYLFCKRAFNFALCSSKDIIFIGSTSSGITGYLCLRCSVCRRVPSMSKNTALFLYFRPSHLIDGASTVITLVNPSAIFGISIFFRIANRVAGGNTFGSLWASVFFSALPVIYMRLYLSNILCNVLTWLSSIVFTI